MAALFATMRTSPAREWHYED